MLHHSTSYVSGKEKPSCWHFYILRFILDSWIYSIYSFVSVLTIMGYYNRFNVGKRAFILIM